MARQYDVTIERTVVERCTITVDADSKARAAFAAGKLTPDWQPKSEKTEVVDIAWKGGE